MSGLSEIPTNHFFLTIALYQDHTIKANDTNIKVSLVEFTLSTLVIQSGCSEFRTTTQAVNIIDWAHFKKSFLRKGSVDCQQVTKIKNNSRLFKVNSDSYKRLGYLHRRLELIYTDIIFAFLPYNTIFHYRQIFFSVLEVSDKVTDKVSDIYCR